MAHVYTSTLWAHLRALELSSSDIEKCESQLPASAKHQVMTGHGPLEPSCPQNGAPSHIVNLQGVQLVQKNPEKIGRCHHIIVAISAQIPKPRAKQPKKSWFVNKKSWNEKIEPCSRRGAWRHLPSCHLAGVALGDIYLRFTWQVWHLWDWTGSGGALGRRGPAALLRGRRGTWRHLPLFHVAGVALGDIYLRFTWQASRLWDWAGSGGALGPRGAAALLCGKRGTWWHLPSFHVAGVALGGIYLRFT